MRCPHCPIPAGRRCKGESHRRLCDLRDRGHPDFDEAYLKPIAGEDGAVTRTAPEVPRVPLAVSLAAAKCPHRTKLPACGCAGKWRCERDAADVAWADCVACKVAEADADAPEPLRT